MKKGDLLRVAEVVRINAGKRRGCVGVVKDLRAGRALVAVSGIFDGEPVDFEEWFAAGALGRNDGKV